jgi:hypothetical protein
MQFKWQFGNLIDKNIKKLKSCWPFSGVRQRISNPVISEQHIWWLTTEKNRLPWSFLVHHNKTILFE